MSRTELGAFLRHRREQLAPADVGLVAGGRRRAVGLRREEVAMLAVMSADYYERIEQGRGPQPSPAMLGAVARALRLSLDERDHVYHLAGHPAPSRQRSLGYADAGLMCVVDALAPSVPALITDAVHTVVAQNALNVALLGEIAGLDGRRCNFLWRWFTDDEVRGRYRVDQHETLGREYVADLRYALGTAEHQAAAADLVAALSDASADFRDIRARQEVSVRHSTRKVLTHPQVGVLDLECDVVLSPPSGQRLVLFRPQPGTPARERIEMLAVVGVQAFGEAVSRD